MVLDVIMAAILRYISFKIKMIYIQINVIVFQFYCNYFNNIRSRLNKVIYNIKKRKPFTF